MNTTIRQATWDDDEQALRLVRQRVFIDEQEVPPPEEWDGRDEGSLHLLAEDEAGRPVACARLWQRPDGWTQVGRMAVLRDWRGRGLGAALMEEALAMARRKDWRRLRLDAQTHALGFYARFGFVAEGPVFLDAGIPHRLMKRIVEAGAHAG